MSIRLALTTVGFVNEMQEFREREKAIRQRLAMRGLMSLVGAELAELTPGRCTIAVARRSELLLQSSIFHGGVTALLVHDAVTIAATTVTRAGQVTLTAEYKTEVLCPAVGERLICRARVIRPGQMLTLVSADVFCLADGVEKRTATAVATIAMVDAAAIAPVATELGW